MKILSENVFTWEAAGSGIGAVAAVGYIALLLVKAILSVKSLRRRDEVLTDPSEPLSETEEPAARSATGLVTVLQPILSGDPWLETALATNLAHAPPGARFVWLVDHDDAEGLRVANRLRDLDERRHADHVGEPPRIVVQVCPTPPADRNPKTMKLAWGLPTVTTPYVAVLDDDTVLLDDNLIRGVRVLEQTACMLYTGLPCYLSQGNFVSRLVAHFVNSNSLLTYLSQCALWPPITLNGMFYVMRTDRLRELDGFEPLACELCDDYAVAKRIRRAGGTLYQGATPVYVHTSVADAGHYMRLLHRWFLFADLLVRDQPLGTRVRLVFFLGLPPLLLWLSVGCWAAGWWGELAWLGLLVARHTLLRVLQRRVFPRLREFSVGMSLLAELLQPVHLLHALCQRSILWRTRRIVLQRAGTFRMLDADAPRRHG